MEGAVVTGRHELPPQSSMAYHAGVDPSGAGRDAFSLAIVHRETTGRGETASQRFVQDVMRSWRSGRAEQVDLEGVVAEIATVCKAYRIRTVWGDKYSAGWVKQAFLRHGISYQHSDFDRSAASVETRPLFAQGRIDLLDHPEMVKEFTILESRPRAGGRVSVDHPVGRHDDHANALAVAVAHWVTRFVRDFEIHGSGVYFGPAAEREGVLPLEKRQMETCGDIEISTHAKSGCKKCEARIVEIANPPHMWIAQ